MTSWIRRVAIGLAIVLSPAASSALNLDYQFDSTNSPDGAPLIHFAAMATFQGSLNSSSTGFDFALDDWAMPVRAIVSDDRRSARLEASALTWSGAPQTVSGAWDLGFSGTVPFTITLTALSVQLTRVDVSLNPDASFRTSRGVSTMTVQGVVEAPGTTVPFAVTGANAAVGFLHSGKFTPAGDFVDFTLSADSVGSFANPLTLFAGSVPGFNLALRASADWDGTLLSARAVVPEPATAALLALGLAVLGARRRA